MNKAHAPRQLQGEDLAAMLRTYPRTPITIEYDGVLPPEIREPPHPQQTIDHWFSANVRVTAEIVTTAEGGLRLRLRGPLPILTPDGRGGSMIGVFDGPGGAGLRTTASGDALAKLIDSHPEAEIVCGYLTTPKPTPPPPKEPKVVLGHWIMSGASVVVEIQENKLSIFGPPPSQWTLPAPEPEPHPLDKPISIDVYHHAPLEHALEVVDQLAQRVAPSHAMWDLRQLLQAAWDRKQLGDDLT